MMKNKDIVLYVILVCILAAVTKGLVGRILYYTAPVFYAIVIAYVTEPMIKGVEHYISDKISLKPTVSWKVSIAVFFTGLVFLCFLLSYLLIPQILSSYGILVSHLDEQLSNIRPVMGFIIKDESLYDPALKKIKEILLYYAGTFGEKAGDAAPAVGNIFISFALAVYILSDKDRIGMKAKETMSLILSEQHLYYAEDFLSRCNRIFAGFVICEFFDALIVGLINALLMMIFDMPYILLTTVVVGVTNLIPTFGPLIGLAFGFLTVFLTDPLKAFIFIFLVIFTQFVDGYIIKPRLFGNSLGLSGVLVLASVMIGQRIGGVTGILLAIPFAAIIKIVWTEWLRPWLYYRKKSKEYSEEKWI